MALRASTDDRDRARGKPLVQGPWRGMTGFLTRPGSDAAFTGCATRLRMCPSASTPSFPPPIRQAFKQPCQKGSVDVWRHVADQLRPRWPKLATLMDESDADVLASMAFPARRRTMLHSTNPLERLHKEVKRRADVVLAALPRTAGGRASLSQ